MICSKHGLLSEPTIFDFLHEKLITIVPLSIAIIAINSKNNCVAKELIDEYLLSEGGK